MSLLDNYLKGEYHYVYDEIQKMGSKAFEPDLFPIIEAVLTETFKRVSYNLDIIYSELVRLDIALTRVRNMIFKDQFLNRYIMWRSCF